MTKPIMLFTSPAAAKELGAMAKAIAAAKPPVSVQAAKPAKP
jgi:hypothetical protein